MLSLQKLALAESENSSIIVINYCNYLSKIVNFKINILRKLVLASQPNFHKAHFMIWSRCWQNIANWGVFPDMNLAAIYKVSIKLKIFCYQNDVYISYGYLVILFRISAETQISREQYHPFLLSLSYNRSYCLSLISSETFLSARSKRSK